MSDRAANILATLIILIGCCLTFGVFFGIKLFIILKGNEHALFYAVIFGIVVGICFSLVFLLDKLEVKE